MKLILPKSPSLDGPVRLLYKGAYFGLRAKWRLLGGKTRGALVAFRHDDRVLLVQNSYRKGLSFPGGYVHPDESPVEAARREVLEEIGLDVPTSALRPMFSRYYKFEDHDDTVDVFELVLDAPIALHTDRREILSAEFIPLAEAVNRQLVPQVRDYVELALARENKSS